MSANTAGPGGRVLWSLRRRRTDVRCVLYADATLIEVQVLQERDLVLKERFLEERLALGWAVEYRSRLLEHGWRDSPADCSPSSAA